MIGHEKNFPLQLMVIFSDIYSTMVNTLLTICALSCMMCLQLVETESIHSQLEIEVETAKALAQRYFAVCTVILHPYEKIPYNVFKFIKSLATCRDQSMVSTVNFVTFFNYLNDLDQTKCPRTMIVIYGDENLIQNQFCQLTLKIQMAGPFWLLFLNKTTIIEDYLDEADLPFDLDLVVAQVENTDTVTLQEVYRVSRINPYLPVRVQRFGSWTWPNGGEGGLISPPHISLYYGSRRNNLEGVVFKVATVASYPIVNYKHGKNGSLDITGYFPVVWKELEARLNFSTNYFIPADQTTGMLRNHSWSGITGMVVRDEAQVGLAAMSISPERSGIVDFLRPLIYTKNNLYYKKPGIEVSWNAIFRPFETGIWVTLFVWIILGAVFLRNLIRFGIIHHCESSPMAPEFTFLNSFFCLLRAFSQQGTPFVPYAAPGRILILMTYLISVVILTAYSGALISFIAVQIPRIPFNTLKEFEKTPYTLLTVQDSASYMYFANATDPTLSSIFRRMPENLPKSNAKALELVCRDQNFVHFGPQAAMDMIIYEKNHHGCEITSMPNALNTVYMSVIIAKKNQYKDALNHHLDMMIYQGILGRLRKQLWKDTEQETERKVEVKAEQVIPIYMVLLAGVILALLAFVAEIYLRRRRNHKTSSPLSVTNLNGAFSACRE